jgi:hypothetical protein
MAHYVVLTDAYTWGGTTVGDDEMPGLCARYEEAANEIDPANIYGVRPARRGEAAGVYRDGQLLGYTVKVPEDVQQVLNQAWEKALQGD